MRRTKLQIVIWVAAVLASAATVQAAITGSLWESPHSGLGDGSSVPASAPLIAPDVTFSVANGPIAFTSITDPSGPAGNLQFNDGNGFNYGAYYTVGSFLGTGGAAILTGNNHANDDLNNVLIELVGQVTLTQGQTFTVTHDDGMTFKVGGNYLINVPGPTAPVTDSVTYNGPSGTYDFDLLYAEVDGPGAVLQLDLPLEPVPEPTTVITGALLLLPFGAGTLRVLRRKRAV